MEILLVLFVCSGLILVGLSIPLIMGKIGPNPCDRPYTRCLSHNDPRPAFFST